MHTSESKYAICHAFILEHIADQTDLHGQSNWAVRQDFVTCMKLDFLECSLIILSVLLIKVFCLSALAPTFSWDCHVSSNWVTAIFFSHLHQCKQCFFVWVQHSLCTIHLLLGGTNLSNMDCKILVIGLFLYSV